MEAAKTPIAGNPVSPKVTAASAGAALGSLIWLVLSIFGVLPSTADPAAVVAATGATSTVLAFLFGYFFKDPTRNVTIKDPTRNVTT